MILYLSFEELSALASSAERVLADNTTIGQGILAPPQMIADVEQFAQRLHGDLQIESLEAQQKAHLVVSCLLAGCRNRLDASILDMHPADEDAVAAYFAYAHVLTVNRRLDLLGEEMRALIEVMTGQDVESEAARRFTFDE